MADPKITLTAVDQTKAAFASVAKNIDGLKGKAQAIGAAFGQFSGIFSGIAAVGAVVALKDAIDAADNLAKLSQRVGVSVESLSTLRFAAQLADTSLESLSAGLKKLSVNMADVQKGTGEAVGAFKAIGVNVETAQGQLKGTDEILLELADKFSGFEDGANKTALAMKIFGEAGANLVPFLNQGRTGIESLRREAERLGLSLGGTTARQAENFNDNLAALSSSVKGFAQAVASSFLPALVQITDQMRLGAQQGGIWQGVLEGLRTAFSRLFNQSTVAGFGATVESINQAIEQQILLIQRLETTPGRRGTRSAIEGVRERQIAAAKAELERLKQESIKAQTLLEFETPGGLNAGVAKRKAPALVNVEAAKQAAAEQERIQKERERALAAFNREVDLSRVRAIEFQERFDAQQQAMSDAQRKRLEDMGRAIVASLDPLDQYVRKLEEVEEAENAGVISARVAGEARAVITQQMADAARGITGVSKAAEEANEIGRELGLTFSSAFEDAIIQGKKFSDVLKAIAQDIAKLYIRKSVTEPGAAAIQKIIGGLFGGGQSANAENSFDLQNSDPVREVFKTIGFPGFASGGSFAVGGVGGTDSQLVAFRASPNERVTIETPGQQRAGGSTYVVNVNAPNAQPGVEQMIRREVESGMRQAIAMSVRAVQAQSDRGGSFASSVGRR